MDWFITDHLGSTKLLIDQNGTHKFTGDDDPFGINLRSFGDKDSHRYTGQILDEEQGVYYYGARYYLPEIGRFLSGDPARQFWSSYLYVGNSPSMAVDPTGCFTEDPTVANMPDGSYFKQLDAQHIYQSMPNGDAFVHMVRPTLTTSRNIPGGVEIIEIGSEIPFTQRLRNLFSASLGLGNKGIPDFVSITGTVTLPKMFGFNLTAGANLSRDGKLYPYVGPGFTPTDVDGIGGSLSAGLNWLPGSNERSLDGFLQEWSATYGVTYGTFGPKPNGLSGTWNDAGVAGGVAWGQGVKTLNAFGSVTYTKPSWVKQVFPAIPRGK